MQLPARSKQPHAAEPERQERAGAPERRGMRIGRSRFIAVRKEGKHEHGEHAARDPERLHKRRIRGDIPAPRRGVLPTPRKPQQLSMPFREAEGKKKKHRERHEPFRDRHGCRRAARDDPQHVERRQGDDVEDRYLLPLQ